MKSAPAAPSAELRIPIQTFPALHLRFQRRRGVRLAHGCHHAQLPASRSRPNGGSQCESRVFLQGANCRSVADIGLLLHVFLDGSSTGGGGQHTLCRLLININASHPLSPTTSTQSLCLFYFVCLFTSYPSFITHFTYVNAPPPPPRPSPPRSTIFPGSSCARVCGSEQEEDEEVVEESLRCSIIIIIIISHSMVNE